MSTYLTSFCVKFNFVICFSSTDEDSPSEDDVKVLLADVRDQLLQGLADDAESIRCVPSNLCCDYTSSNLTLNKSRKFSYYIYQSGNINSVH